MSDPTQRHIEAPKSDRPMMVTINHPLGLYMAFPANAHNTVRLLAFAGECIDCLENQSATEDWSV